jgi:hypothetical protein
MFHGKNCHGFSLSHETTKVFTFFNFFLGKIEQIPIIIFETAVTPLQSTKRIYTGERGKSVSLERKLSNLECYFIFIFFFFKKRI